MMYRTNHAIVSSHRSAAGTTTIVPIPIGSVVELLEERQRSGLVEITWEGKHLRIFSMDLFDCAERITAT